jgi:hypothetical protein
LLDGDWLSLKAEWSGPVPRAGIAGAENTHRKALLFPRKPACDVGRANRERAARDANDATEHEILPNCVACAIRKIGTTHRSISTKSTMRPPNLSVHMPSGTRINDPVNTGVAVRRSNSVALRFSVLRIGMPMTPNIIHTMKRTVNANVLTISMDNAWPRLLIVSPIPIYQCL